MASVSLRTVRMNSRHRPRGNHMGNTLIVPPDSHDLRDPVFTGSDHGSDGRMFGTEPST